jgi:hypothetical protein
LTSLNQRALYMNLSQSQVKYLQSTRLHFCIPCYGGNITEGTFISLMKWMATAQKIGMNFTIDTMVNESLVTRARGSLTAKFLAFEPKSTHLMFVDADIGFEPEEIIKLVLADKDVIGGLYPKKALPISYVVNKAPNSKTEGEMITVSNLGTGFLLIKRQVIETLIQRNPDLFYRDAIGLDERYSPFKYAIFDTMIDPATKEYLSEDYVFCKRWRDIGGEVWAHLGITLRHAGYYSFTGDATLLKPHLQ